MRNACLSRVLSNTFQKRQDLKPTSSTTDATKRPFVQLPNTKWELSNFLVGGDMNINHANLRKMAEKNDDLYQSLTRKNERLSHKVEDSIKKIDERAEIKNSSSGTIRQSMHISSEEIKAIRKDINKVSPTLIDKTQLTGTQFPLNGSSPTSDDGGVLTFNTDYFSAEDLACARLSDDNTEGSTSDATATGLNSYSSLESYSSCTSIDEDASSNSSISNISEVDAAYSYGNGGCLSYEVLRSYFSITMHNASTLLQFLLISIYLNNKSINNTLNGAPVTFHKTYLTTSYFNTVTLCQRSDTMHKCQTFIVIVMRL